MAFRKKRLLAIVLAAMMTIQLCPTLSFASENADDAVTVQAETVEQEEAKDAETVEEAKEEETEPAAEEKQEEAEPAAEEKQEEAEPAVEEETKAEEEAEPAAEEETKAEEKAEPAAEEASESAAKEETGQQPAEEESGATQQPAEEAAAAASTEQPAEEVFTAGELVFHGHDYDVTLEYDEAAKISASAELKVKEIVKGSSEYESYLKGAEAAVDKGVAEARFFDITIWADGKEVQPESPVKVNISYKEAIEVAEEGEVQAMHFKDGSKKADVIDSDTNSGSEVDEIKFEADSFSVYGVIYTVDFTYDGYTFSMPGEGTILLSELAKKLNLYEKDLDKSFSVKNVKDVSFTDYDLVKLEKQADGDWLLTSLAPFSSEETLTVTMKDGVKFVIGVTDEQVSSNLTDFLTNAVITGATQDSEGKYKVEAGKEYNIILSFAENSAHQFDNRATLKYTMPDGLKILSPQTGDLKVNIVYKGRTYQVDATYDLDTDGNLEIEFDEDDPDFHHLENATNVSFRFSYNGAFDGSEDKIHFSEDLERDIVFDEPEPGQAYVSKSGTFDEETGKFSYTITVNATGDVTNVNIKDVISGNALIFNNDVRVSGNSSSYRDNGATNGFDYTFASMQEGDVITITYSASVDFSKDTDKDGKITVDQTKNTATVKPEGGEPHTSEYSHEIAFKTTKKSNGENTGTTADGDKIYKWTITYNELRLASAGGDTIKDTIAADSTEYMKYYGDGLSIKVIDKNGNTVDTRNVPYSALQSYSDSSWTYKIPEGDSQPYMYEITYYTVVDMEKVEGTGNTVTVSNTANGSSGSAGVTPESVISVDKSVESFTTEEVNWKITLGVPENGLTQAVVTDTFPSIWLNGRNIYDLLQDGSLQITGLLDGESYTVENVGQGQVKITFFQDPGKRITGLKATPGGHTITVKLTTLVDQEWLQKGYETGGYEQNHTNSVDFNGKTDTATVTFGKPGIEKKGDALTDTEGNITGLKYTVVLKGVSETPVSVLDTFDTSILEVDTAKASSWDHMRIWGGNQWSQDAGRMPVSYTDTGDGIILTADTVPMQTDGSYYPYYKIVYYLKVKDGVDLKALAIANGGEYDVDNTAKWGDYESEFTYKVEYDYLDKKLLNAGELGGTNRTAQYQITFNPSKATLNEGSDMIMTDVLSANLSVDYGSIKIETDPAGQNVIYSLSGGDGGTTVATYTIPDSTKVTITYEANVRGNGSQTIVNKVSVNGKEETVENTKSYGSASEGEGAQASFKIVKVDGYDANKKLQGVKFKVFCENPDVDFGGGQKELILVTDENGEITFDGDAYTFYFDEVYHVQEVEAPEDYGTISFDYLVTLTNDMSKVDYGHYIYYYSDSMQIKNWPLEGLVVEKQVESSDQADLEAYYSFRISVLNDDGSVNTDFNEKSGDDQFENGVARFQLKAGEQKMFWGFAKGTKYKVEEVDAEGFVTTVKYSVYDEDGNVKEVKTETTTEHTGVLTQDDETIIFKNKKTSNGSLKLKKLVTVNGEATTGTLADGDYTFTIKGPSGATAADQVTKTVVITVTGGAAVSATVDGVSATLDADKYVEVADLEAGEYTITETAPTNGTSLVGGNGKKVTVEAGKIGTDVTAKADFTNNIDTGSLKIKKNVTVNGEATTGTEADGDYIFEVKDAEGTVVATETITITNGASKEVQVDELVPGTYTVSEDTSKLPEGKGMVLVGDNDIEIEVAAGETAEVPTAEFTNNKPGTPEFKKKIQDTNDSTGVTSDWQDSADYDIGDAVPFKLTATLPKDVSTNKNYSIRFEDQMEESLTFKEITKVLLKGEETTAYDLVNDGDQRFTVSMSWIGDDISDALNGATVEVYFTATLNENAKIGSEGNVNAARLHYDNKSEITEDSGKTPWDYVIAFTYKLDLSKVDQDGEALTGAEFKLEKKLADGSLQEIDLSNTGNVFKGTGLDDGTYVLTETKAPEGYKPIDPIEFTVTADHTVEWKYTSTGDTPAFDVDSRTAILTALTGDTESGDLEFAETQSVEGLEGTVTNQKTGSLKIKKNVTVDGKTVTDTSADGEYTFVVKDAEGNEVSRQTIKIENGVSGEVQVDGLVPGTYTVSEETGTNPAGMQLVTENDLQIVVTAGENAEIPTAEFTNNKPGTPTFEKKIQDTNDSTGETSGWQDSADYDIGDEVPFKLTATLANDVSSYKTYSIRFEDEMEESLTFKGIDQIVLTKNDGSTQDIAGGSVINPASGGHKFTVSIGWGMNYSTQMPINEALNGAKVEVYFTATLNENAKVGSEGNVNAARMRYSNNPNNADSFEETPWDYVIAFTYKLDLSKVDQDNKALKGAEFKLEKVLANNSRVEIELSNTGNVFTGKGLDDGTYVLTETKTPTGYKPIAPITFTVSAEHEVTWDYNSGELNFNGDGRTAILTALTGTTKSGDLEFTAPQTVDGLKGTVTNKPVGSLKLKKQVTVNGEATEGTEADGTYTFTITGPSSAAAADQVTKTVEITVEGGVAKSATLDGKAAELDSGGYVEVAGLDVGEYTITETAPTNGTYLVGDNDRKVTVVAGESGKDVTAKAEFTNNKPGTPEFEKKIQDTNDTTGETSGWQDSADYDIGDDVPFKLTATLPKDVSTNKNYTIRFEDRMEESLTFKEISDVTLNGESIKDDCVINSEDHKFTVSKTWSNEDITTALDSAAVEVLFTATLNENARAGSEGNVNAARLHYDNKPFITEESGKKTPWDYVIAFTYKLDLSKVDQDGKALTGAEFKLEKKIKDGNPVEVDLTVEGNVFKGTGLDDGTYVLTETKAPEGYKPIDPIEFTVTATHGVEWVYNSTGDAPAFDVDSRTAILTALTGATDSGDLKFADPQSVEGLEGTVKNQGQGAIKIEKIVTGTEIKDKDFTFKITLTAPEGTKLESSYAAKLDGKDTERAKVGKDGVVTVTIKAGQTYEITELPAGTKYVVTEVTPLPGGYSEGTHKGTQDTIEVGKTKNVTMNNIYKSSGEIKIKAKKALNGRPLEDKQFTFELMDEAGKVIQTVQNSSDGTVEFASISYTQADITSWDAETGTGTGSKKYKVKETIETKDGYTYDETEFDITVTLTDNGAGIITAAQAPELKDLVFTNEYKAEGEVVLGARKELVGKTIKEDQFSFELKDAEGKVLQTKKNAADGSVTFDAVKYTQDDIYEKDAETGVYSGASTKTYNYTINEVIPEGATPSKSGGNTFEYKGYTFDATVYTVAVVLKDNGDGTITATASPDAESLAFTNAYGAAGTLKLDAEKTFKNGTLKGDEFTFELKDADGKVLQSKKNDAAGNVSFDLITYKMEDLAKSPFKYTVSEVTGDKEDVKYDNTVYTVTVTLKDNDDGTLTVEKKIDNGGKLKFMNEQLNVNTSITLGGVKVLKGQTLKANQFKFVLTDENGKKISTAKNDADGNFTFKEINYKLSDLNGEAERVYTYKVSEVKGIKSNIVYDTKVYTVKVTVTDNGDGTMTATADLDKKSIKFVNKTVTKKKTTSKKSGTKKSSGTKRKGAGTGDNSPLGLLFGGLAVGAAGIAALLWARKKRNKKS